MKIRSSLLSLLSVALLLGSATTASAEPKSDGFYARLDSGYSFPRKFEGAENDDSFIVGAGIGYRFMTNVRADLTVSYRGGYGLYQTDLFGPGTDGTAEADIETWVGLVSVYYDFNNSSRVTPYLGGGIGVARTTLDDADVRQSGSSIGYFEGATKNSFAWHLSAGLGVRLSPGVSLDVGYRYLDMGKFESGTTGMLNGAPVGVTGEGDLRAHEIQVGLRIDF